MSEVRVNSFYNEKCISCHAVDETMVKVGPVPFCDRCFRIAFVNQRLVIPDNLVDSDSGVYRKWLEEFLKLQQSRS
jgi:hypothetical protein